MIKNQSTYCDVPFLCKYWRTVDQREEEEEEEEEEGEEEEEEEEGGGRGRREGE